MKWTDKLKYTLFGDKPDKETGRRPIETAAMNGDVEAVQYYLEHGCSDIKGKRHFMECVTDMDVLKQLFKKGIYPKDSEKLKEVVKSTMFRDSSSLTPANIKFCRAAGVSLASKDRYGFSFMMDRSRSEEQRQTWMAHAHPNQIVEELAAAAERNDMETLKLLSQSPKITIDTPDKDGRTAAWHAIYAGHLKAADFLGELGANLNPRDKENRSPFQSEKAVQIRQPLMHKAVLRNAVNQAAELFAAGADTQDAKLMEYAGSSEMMTLLRQHKAPYDNYLRLLEHADSRRDSMEPSPDWWKMDIMKGFRREDNATRQAANDARFARALKGETR